MLQISQKTFLSVGLVLLFLICSGLFMYHNQSLDPKKTGNWWAIRFVSLDDRNDLRFEVENYSPVTEGTYQVFTDTTLHEEGTLEAVTNTVTMVIPTKDPISAKRIRIVVKLGNKEQSLIR